jgi:hypothetical protein
MVAGLARLNEGSPQQRRLQTQDVACTPGSCCGMQIARGNDSSDAQAACSAHARLSSVQVSAEQLSPRLDGLVHVSCQHRASCLQQLFVFKYLVSLPRSPGRGTEVTALKQYSDIGASSSVHLEYDRRSLRVTKLQLHDANKLRQEARQPRQLCACHLQPVRLLSQQLHQLPRRHACRPQQSSVGQVWTCKIPTGPPEVSGRASRSICDLRAQCSVPSRDLARS